jgi:hypothetical protein
MLSTNTIRVIPRYNQNYNPNIIPTSTKIVNYNSNTLIYPKTHYQNKSFLSAPSITVSQNEPYFSSKVYSYNQNYQPQYTSAPRIQTSHSLTNIHSLDTIKISNYSYNAVPSRRLSALNTLDYSNGIGNHAYNTMSYNYLNNYNNYPMMEIEPQLQLKLSEFIILNQIGKGSEGVIYTVKWRRNNKNYAMKKCEIQSLDDLNSRKQEIITLQNYINSTGSDGVLKTYGCKCVPNNVGYYDFYEVMELAERDWEREIGKRQINRLFYNEYELMEILRKLVRTFSSLQTNHITHRDIKPQNIMFVNGVLKICDFGNAKILKKKGIVVQRIRGSELFMSPTVFKAYHAGYKQIQHNTFKSDVFSLGMCLFFAAGLSYDGPSTIREIYDMNVIRKVLYQYLGRRYSQNFINILWTMLQVDEKQRPDFNQLQIMFNLY